MQPYGDRGHWETEDFGPPSKMGNLDSKHRRESRRLLHKQARNDVKLEIKKQTEDMNNG